MDCFFRRYKKVLQLLISLGAIPAKYEWIKAVSFTIDLWNMVVGW